jgi:NAD(P)-dependent dehydrogenase (short-subunit alcohol dehydrogenase family)
MGRMDGQIALVTGGASGLGTGIAQRFVEEGAIVTITDIQVEKGQQVAADLGATFMQHNVTDEDQWRSIIATVVEQHGRLDTLVNNAGIFNNCPVDEMLLEDWQRVINVNLTGVFLGCKYGVAALKKNPGNSGGSIINMSSVTGKRGQIGGTAYSASKGAVHMLTKSVAMETAALKIRCNSIHPGIIDTPILDPTFAAAEDPDAIRAHIEGYLPIGYMGDAAHDIGNMAVFLASDDATYITGAEMVVDGGMIVGLPS